MGSYDPEMDGYVPPDISLADLTLGDKIGEGSFGDVYRAVVADPNGGPPIAAIAKAYKRNVRGRDWFSFYADERAVCRRLAEVGCGRRALPRRVRIGRVSRVGRRRRRHASAALERDDRFDSHRRRIERAFQSPASRRGRDRARPGRGRRDDVARARARARRREPRDARRRVPCTAT